MKDKQKDPGEQIAKDSLAVLLGGVILSIGVVGNYVISGWHGVVVVFGGSFVIVVLSLFRNILKNIK